MFYDAFESCIIILCADVCHMNNEFAIQLLFLSADVAGFIYGIHNQRNS